jgi:hypothetical protein
MSYAPTPQDDHNVISNVGSEAAILFARAMDLYHDGQLDRAITLFDKVLTVCEQEDTQKVGLPCVAAHISLYKIHSALGHDREAAEHFSKAVGLGASAQRLMEC